MADFLVTTLADTVDPNDTVLSLREALALANGSAGSDTITFEQTLAGGTLTLTSGELQITTNDITIDGDIVGDSGPDITISGNNAGRVFLIDDGTAGTIAAALNGLVITGGAA